MRSYSGFKKKSLTNKYLLLANGEDKSLGDFVGSVSYNSSTKKLQYTPIGGSATDIATFGDRAFDSTSYLPLSGGTMNLGEGLKFHSDDNYFGTNADARIISLLDGNGTTCDGGLIIDERATSNGTVTITELLRIRDSEFKWKG